MNWFRWYIGTCTDAKLHKASRIAGCRRAIVIAAWAAMLEEARRGNGDGNLSIEPDGSWLAYQIDWPTPKCEAVLKGMREVGLLIENCIPAFSHRQFISDDVAVRVRAHRAKALTNKETGVARNVTLSDPVTPPEQNRTDTENPPTPSEYAPQGANGKANGHTKAKRGARLAEDWEPSPDAIEHCKAELGCSAALINSEWPAFQCHFLAATGATARKLDWNRTFINWMRRARRDELRRQEIDQRWQRARGQQH